MHSTNRPTPLRYCFFAVLSIVAFSLSGKPLHAQLADERVGETLGPPEGSRASVAVGIAAQRLQVADDELMVVNHAQIGDFTSIKVAHPRTGRITVVDLDASNREVARERVEQVLAARRSQGFRGKQERELAERVNGRPADELTTVLVWGRLPGPPPRIERPVPGQGGSAASERAFRDFHVNAMRGVVDHARRQRWIVEYQAEDAPVVVLKVPNGQLQALEARADVEALYLGREYRPELNNSTAAMDANKVWARGFTGAGVKIAVIEVPEDIGGGVLGDSGIYFGHLSLADGIYCNPGSLLTSKHATGVAGIIASNHATYKGVAYGAPALLSGNTNGTDADIIKCTEWAVDQGARVINYSFGAYTANNQFAGLDRYVDYVIRNRSVTIVKSAGNSSATGACTSPNFYVTTPGKGYNVLTVGSYSDANTASNADDVMSSTSCYGDPYSVFSDREKPEVAAPGVSIITTCTSSNTCTGADSGTSFAAPHVAGCAALLMHRNSVLTVWPESVRAILMASAVTNIEGSTRLSEKDGAGGIECDSADEIVSALSGGEQHDVVSSGSFPRDFIFSTAAGKTVRAVIAWDSTPSEPVGTTAPASDPLKADLELTVYAPNGTVVATSYSRDNSFEIVEFTAPATGVYTARVSAARFEGDTEFLAFAWWQGTREK